MSSFKPSNQKLSHSIPYAHASHQHPHCDCPRDRSGHCVRFIAWWEDMKVNTLIEPPLYHLINHLLRTEIPSMRKGSLFEEIHSLKPPKLSNPNSDYLPNKNLFIRCCSEIVLGRDTINHIDVDITRTYPSIHFFDKYGSIQLKRLLQSYAFYDPEIGYVQGMNFIAGFLLWHSTEQQAFWMLVALMHLRDLRQMYLPNFPGLFKRCSIIETLMKQNLPRLYSHLEKFGINSVLFSSEWLLTIFTSSVPFDALNKIWDKFIKQGWNFVYKLILKRISKLEEKLIELDELDALLGLIKYGDPKGKPINHSKKRLETVDPTVPLWNSTGEERRGIMGSAVSQFQKIFNKYESALPEINSAAFWSDLIEEATYYNLDGQYLKHVDYSSYLRVHSLSGYKAFHPILENLPNTASDIKSTPPSSTTFNNDFYFRPKIENSISSTSELNKDTSRENSKNLDYDFDLFNEVPYFKNFIDEDDSDIIDIDLIMSQDTGLLDKLRLQSPSDLDCESHKELDEKSSWVNIDSPIHIPDTERDPAENSTTTHNTSSTEEDTKASIHAKCLENERVSKELEQLGLENLRFNSLRQQCDEHRDKNKNRLY